MDVQNANRLDIINVKIEEGTQFVLEKDPKELEKILKQMREKQKNLKEKDNKNNLKSAAVHSNHKELMSDSDEE